MKTFKTFDIALQGASHARQKTNCQDHAFIQKDLNLGIGIVSDGVGALKYAEFMSLLLASSTLKFLSSLKIESENQLLKDVSKHIADVKEKGLSLLRDKERKESYAATLLFYIVTPQYSYIFTQGDGFYGINDDVYKVDGNSYYIENCTLRFEQKIETEKVDKIWVSTDGLRYSEKIMKYLKDKNELNDLIDLISEEEKKEMLKDDFGLALSWRL